MPRRRTSEEQEAIGQHGVRGPARRSVVEQILGDGWSITSTFGGRVRAVPTGEDAAPRFDVLTHGLEFQGIRLGTGIHEGKTRCEIKLKDDPMAGTTAQIVGIGIDERAAFKAVMERLATFAGWFRFTPPKPLRSP